MKETLTEDSSRDLSPLRCAFLSLALTLCVWTFFSWPLPPNISRGIPSSARNVEHTAPRYMVPGDHLQFYYYFMLVSDFVKGEVPPFYNLYEFNTGNDEDRYSPGSYYAPFSLLFALLSPMTGHVAAWNLVGFFSLWLSFWFTWRLLLRYVRDPWIAGTAAMVSVIFPYRWIALAGGSPTGLGMMWVPAAFLGLEMMVLDRRALGGFLAGLSIYLSSWVDEHVFFFTVVAAPIWVLFAWALQSDRLFPRRREAVAYLKAAAPLLLFLLPAAAQVLGTRRRLSGTDIGEAGRSLREVSLFSPEMRESLVFWKGVGTSEIYIGILIALLVLLGLLAFFSRNAVTGRERYRILAGIVLCSVMAAGIVVLASGVNNPLGSRGWRALTRLIPPYAMIRDPKKIYCLMPTLLSVAAVLSLRSLTGALFSPKARRAVLVAAGLLLLFDYRIRLRTQVCLLDSEQGAYAAMVEDAAAEGAPPHMLALPLWPGNSHWTSINQYYAGLYGVRMVNGYKPTVPDWYMENVFLPFEKFNKGSYPTEMLGRLKTMGVGYIVLHEDAFPEKVSPFGVSHTLLSLLRHPELSFLRRDKAAWSFKIAPSPKELPFPLPDWDLRSSVRFWELEHSRNELAEVIENASSSRGHHLRLREPSSAAATRPYPLFSMDGLRYLVRIRGRGRVEASLLRDDKETTKIVLDVDADSWTWEPINIPQFDGYHPFSINFTLVEGDVDIDVAGLFASEQDLPLGRERVTLPAPVFFHAGYSDLLTGEVVLSPDRVQADTVFYGPRIPLAAGEYRIAVDFRSEAPAGTTLGHLSIKPSAGDSIREAVVAGTPFSMDYQHLSNLPFSLALDFSGRSSLRIGAVTVDPAGRR